jgi:8-oxo-dGTP pyrophosphatase MutT (NUDIX family)/GNAT superfamily N-acetyltransferase
MLLDRPDGVVCYLRRNDRVLLQLKAEGRFGGGLWNAPGGKIDDGESPRDAVVREFLEETGLAIDPIERARLTFYFGDAPEAAFDVYVYTSDSYEGDLVASDEGHLEWHPVNALPYERMWPDDAFWLPKVLAGHRVAATFRLSGDMTRVIEHDVRALPPEGFVIRRLERDELSRVWEIDRREFVEKVYRLQGGQLVLEPHNFDVPGWAPGQREEEMPMLFDCFDRGGTFWGAFEDDVIVGAAGLESNFIGARRKTLQLTRLHVSRDLRGQGLGTALFQTAADHAKRAGAEKLYISATESENSVNFYQRRGCRLATEVDPGLLALEPEDIHLECELASD